MDAQEFDGITIDWAGLSGFSGDDEDGIPRPDTVTSHVRSRVHGPPISCPLCQFRGWHMKRHVYRRHLPWYVAPISACWLCHVQQGSVREMTRHLSRRHKGSSSACFGPEHHDQWFRLMSCLFSFLAKHVDKDGDAMSLEGLMMYAGLETILSERNRVVLGKEDTSQMTLYCQLSGVKAPRTFHVDPPNCVASMMFWRTLAELTATDIATTGADGSAWHV